MRVVIADTGPLHYLVLIGHVEILPALFERVFIPSAVRNELAHVETPLTVRQWISHAPQWLNIHSAVHADFIDEGWFNLDPGEKEAIALADSLGAELVLMDDRAGFRVAIRRGFAVTGTLGILAMAARANLLNLGEAFDKLKATNFRYPPKLLEEMLEEDRRRKLG
ncbi:MAG: DUF3368 domain-containing protein [Verrucomicrobia bacterium]|nr:DUF3368 domain-containing protein [Verrucomicrobiota bacterium]